MMNMLKSLLRRPKLMSGLSIIILAAILLELISAVQYYYSHNVLERELEHRAETELTLKAIIIKGTLHKTEQMLRDYSWDIFNSLDVPDSVVSELHFLVDKNREVLSSGMAFVPNYYPSKGYWYEPFAKVENGVPVCRQIGSETHDYTQMEFYKNAVETGKPYWADPYVDIASDGEDTLITTQSMPIYDVNGKLAGVFAIDVSLGWLSDTLNARHAYPSSFDLLLTESGGLVCYPKKPHPNAEDVNQVHQLINDSTVARRMSNSGRSKIIDFRSPYDGDKGYIFYANMKGRPHWQLAVVCYEKEVYGTLKHMRRLLMLAMLTALGLLGFIVFRFARGARKLHIASVEQERIGSELRIARNLQMSMLPVKYPAFPERDDIDVKGMLMPAREVGGDLYDFFIRDEKLFFCIGDVSGKGVPSALVMAISHALFYSSSSHESNPALIMRELNETASRNNDKNMFVTFFIGVLDLPTGRLRYCNAGHDAPMLIGQNDVSLLPVNANLPIGVIEDYKYEAQETILEPDTTLFLYTDGLTEAMDKDHNQFGLQRAIDVMGPYSGMENPLLDDMLVTVQSEVNAFVKNAEQSDDLTLLMIRYTPKCEEVVFGESISLKNDLSQVPELNKFVASFTSRLNIEPSLESQIKLAVEEAVVNVMDYAYPIGTEGDISVEAQSNSSYVTFIISDTGKPFDPTEGGRVDTTLSVEDRPIGGLGIFLVRELMDSINYERIEGKNILTLKKKYKL